MRIPVDAIGTHIVVNRHHGSGPHMLLIHGITSSSADFNPVIGALATICRPVTIDLRGHGYSDKPPHGYHYQDYVRDLSEVIAALKLDRPIVMGHSLGGIIAMYWSAQNPGIAPALIIEDSPLRSGEDFRGAFDGWLALNAMAEDELRAWYAAKYPEWSGTLLRDRTRAMHTTALQAIRELMTASMANDGLDSTDVLSGINEPVLFLHGDVETGSMVHPEDLATLPVRINEVTVRRIQGAGHTIHRSHANEWLQHVQEFIARIET